MPHILRSLLGGLFALVASLAMAFAQEETPGQADPELDPGDQCLQSVQSEECADILKKLGLAIGEPIKKCSEFRECKSSCREVKRDCKADCRDAKKSCRAICDDLSGREKRQCRRACGDAVSACRQDCRATKRVCKTECKGGMSDECREARGRIGDIFAAGGNCGAEIVQNEACAEILTEQGEEAEQDGEDGDEG